MESDQEDSRQSFVNEEQDPYTLQTDQGYFILSHSFVGSSTWHMGIIVRDLAVFLIHKAAHHGWKYYCPFQKKEILVQRGEILCAQTRLFQEFGGGITFKQFRGAFDKLVKSGFQEIITPKCVKGAHSYTHIKICKYEGYQNQENYKGQLKGSLRAVEGQRNKLDKLEKVSSELFPTSSVNNISSVPNNNTFDQFWEIYPRKVAKGSAMKVWGKLSEETRAAILKVISNGYVWPKEIRFTPHPATWLNQKRWEDDQSALSHDDYNRSNHVSKFDPGTSFWDGVK